MVIPNTFGTFPIFSRKCKFICSNCVIVACFQIEFNKYKYLQKIKHIRNQKPFKCAHFQNLINYTTILTKNEKSIPNKKNYLWHMMSIQISQICKKKKMDTSFKNQMFYQKNNLRKCKFICSNYGLHLN